jgi:heme o synthase
VSRVSPTAAIVFGVVLGCASFALLALAVNPLAAVLSMSGLLGYVLVYTMWLKRSTPQNIVIGGAAGAFPPMIGWAAVTGTVSIDAAILFMIIFLWTPPHFWALALYKKGDYEAAGIPMLPNVAGERVTQNQIVIYTVLLTVTAFGPVLTGLVGWFYAVPAAALGVVFAVLAVRLRFSAGAEMKRRARVLFTYSLSYLFVLFVALLADVGLIKWFGAL